MIALVERLIARGHAYAAEGHVLFDVASDPDYGSLARRALDEMLAGARVEVAPYKRDPMDFVLWKPSQRGGRSRAGTARGGAAGRAGTSNARPWSENYLGEMFDIHGGGIDLVFPHHENEVAQSTCAHGTKIMANVWMHNGHLQVEGQKMSKSLGNFVTIRDLLDNWGSYGWPGEALRIQHAAHAIPAAAGLDLRCLDEAHKTLWDWSGSLGRFGAARREVPEAVLEALSDDLNTPAMIAELHKLFKESNIRSCCASFSLLGFSEKGKTSREPRARRKSGPERKSSGSLTRIAWLPARRRTGRKPTASATSLWPWASP